jgi:2-amino-4-hydroxy-6-hydroxymethyldihydropteridine diphosphokinase
VPQVWISVGSNLQREPSIRGAVAALRERFGDLVVSPVYQGEAVGCDGPAFYNLVVGLDTELPPERLGRILRDIEDVHGRVREADRFAPRTLDLDLLTWGDAVLDRDGFALPRDEILKYAFVLRPLADVAGEEVHPVVGCSYAELWAEFDQAAQPLKPVPFCFA